MYMCIYFV